jgi:hypothetical protein
MTLLYILLSCNHLLFISMYNSSCTDLLTWGHAIVQAVSRRRLPAEVRVLVRFNLCGICGGQSVTWTGFSPRSSAFLSIVIYYLGDEH